ncbi:hypothetical protein TrCOL_g11593 [Triparma columacea]|uniref:Uncharacterized protein n=1 Tax=Triparma columacea TaxID=722753 RepID=A0A9W7GF39_9STRA|nr:hypothetical protein TrCOL_g11593 [Triparma columacea]
MADNVHTPRFDFGTTEILDLASKQGWVQRRPEASSTLFFRNVNKEDDLINIFYTTGGVMTQIEHPKSGIQQLWRNNVYATLDDLRAIFENPRIHTGQGYRRVNDKMIACCSCGDRKSVSEFSKNQARSRRFGSQKCQGCIEKYNVAALNEDFVKITIEDTAGGGGKAKRKKKAKKKKKKEVEQEEESEAEPQTLTEANLDVHNDEIEYTFVNSGELQRRQFCCGKCVPPNVFFKKVPKYKPVVKCPECKKFDKNTPRLEAVPIHKERGYAHFKCGLCNATWGSSRGGRSLGNFCMTPTCPNKINDVPIYPITIKPFKKNHKRSSKQKQAERAAIFQRTLPPMESEDAEDEQSYAAYSASNRAGADSRHNPYSHSEDSYDFIEDASSMKSIEDESSNTKYEHRCTGCATGICRNRKIPLSKLHASTGSTNSSSGRTGATWSVVSGESGRFQDRDEAFVPTTSL